MFVLTNRNKVKWSKSDFQIILQAREQIYQLNKLEVTNKQILKKKVLNYYCHVHMYFYHDFCVMSLP